MMTLVAAGTLVCGIAISGCSSSGGKSNANATNSNCTPKWHFTTISKGVLTVIAVNNPPTIQIDPNTGKAEGVDAEVLPKFAKDNCLTVRWEALDGAAAVAAMSSGRGDVGSGGWGITAKRGKVIGQMSSPTFCDGASVLSKQPIASYDALKAAADKGVTVGVEGGSLYQQPLTSLIGSSHVPRTLLKRVGLADRADFKPAQLSGGQRQRIAIARALALDPKILLLDEPTSSIDPELRVEVRAVIDELADGGMTMVLVTHEIRYAARVADRMLFLSDGEVVEYGTPDEVVHHPRQERTQRFLRAVGADDI